MISASLLSLSKPKKYFFLDRLKQVIDQYVLFIKMKMHAMHQFEQVEG